MFSSVQRTVHNAFAFLGYEPEPQEFFEFPESIGWKVERGNVVDDDQRVHFVDLRAISVNSMEEKPLTQPFERVSDFLVAPLPNPTPVQTQTHSLINRVFSLLTWGNGGSTSCTYHPGFSAGASDNGKARRAKSAKTRSIPLWSSSFLQGVKAFSLGYLLFSGGQSSFQHHQNRGDIPTPFDFLDFTPPSWAPLVGFTALSVSLQAQGKGYLCHGHVLLCIWRA